MFPASTGSPVYPNRNSAPFFSLSLSFIRSCQVLFITYCHVLLRPPRFTSAYRFPTRTASTASDGIHGNHGLSRLPIPSSRVVSRPFHFVLDGLKRDCRGRREFKVNLVLENATQIGSGFFLWFIIAWITHTNNNSIKSELPLKGTLSYL